MKLFGFEITRQPRAKYDLRSLNKLKLADDDVLVIHCERQLTAEMAEQLQKHIKRVFGEREVLIMDKGLSITIVSPGGHEPSPE